MLGKVSWLGRAGCAAVVCACLVSAASAAIPIETVPVGNTGNTGEWSGQSYGGYNPDRICGAVDYAYNIGKYEVTAGQYTAFLNAVAGVDAYGLYITNMWADSHGCKIDRYAGSGTAGDPYQYRVAADYADRPVDFVSWGDAARFTNWLTNEQPIGAEGPGTTETGSYALNGAMTDAALLAVTRIAEAGRVAGKDYYFITSEDEWYKAAYHKNDGDTGNYFDYPTSSNSVPSNQLIDPDPGNNATFYRGGYTIGSPYWRTEVGAHENSDSPYGTFDQGGNVWEWNEAILGGSSRGMRGWSFYNNDSLLLASYRLDFYPTNENSTVGFRVSEVPEPATMAVLALGSIGMLLRRRGVRR